MGFKLFDELGNEDYTGVAAELSIEEIIAADDAVAEVQEAGNEVIALSRAMDEGQAMSVSLEEQITVESALLSKPEKIAASTVILAQESMRVTAAILGADINALNISNEAIEKSPVTALEISIEEKESLLKRVISQLKLILSKIIASVKKLGAKLVVAVSGVENKAKAQAKAIKELKPNKAPKSLSEKTVKSINSKYSAIVAIDHSILRGIEHGLLYSSPDVIGSFGQRLGNIAQIAADGISELGSDESENGKVVAKINETIKKSINDDFTAKKDNLVDSDDKDGIISSINGNAIKVFGYKLSEETSSSLSEKDAIAAIKANKFFFNTVKVESPEAKLTPMPVSDMSKINKQVSDAAKDIKKYLKTVDSSEKLYKNFIEKVDKKDYKDYKVSAVSAAAHGLQSFNGSVVPSAMLGQLSAIKAGLSIVNMMMSEYK